MGGITTFECDGTIALSAPLLITGNTTIDATGRDVVLSGGNAIRLFNVQTGAVLTLRHLILADGRSPQGAGIHNNRGSVYLREVTFTNLVAVGQDQGSNGEGGAIYNLGRLTAERCWFVGNAAEGAVGRAGLTEIDGTPGNPGGGGFGGALVNLGEADLIQSLFDRNAARGGMGGQGGDAASTNDPRASSRVGGDGAAGGAAAGGAIDHRSNALRIAACTFVANLAVGGAGGAGGRPRSSPAGPGGMGGSGGAGGMGSGGALLASAGFISLTNATFATNRVEGGAGGLGSAGSDCRSGRGEGGDGGIGGIGGGALGGALFRAGAEINLTYSTFVWNGAQGGLGGTGGSGGEGCLTSDGARGAAGGTGLGLGGALASGVDVPTNSLRVEACILAHSATGSNCFGGLMNLGSNISTDRSFNFGPPNPLDPVLGPFGLNGGAVPTASLLPTSPAVDGVISSGVCPLQDARGVRRDARCDIGSFELTPMALRIVVSMDGLRLCFSAVPDTDTQLQSSEDLESWQFVAIGRTDSNGLVDFELPAQSSPVFFRLATP